MCSFLPVCAYILCTVLKLAVAAAGSQVVRIGQIHLRANFIQGNQTWPYF